MTLRRFITWFCLAVIAIVVFQNMEVVTLKFLFWEITMSRIIFYPVLVGLGCVLVIVRNKGSAR
jgi:uncharacterized integral membrane protein